MTLSDLVDVSKYMQRYKLKKDVLGLTRIMNPEIDINAPGIIMHGSEKEPFTILKYGLLPQQTPDDVEQEWQICIGLNTKNEKIRLGSDGIRKNPAVKYAGYLSREGMIYVLDECVKTIEGYQEFWEDGVDGRGYGFVKHPIPSKLIIGLVTTNVPLAVAAMYSAEVSKFIFTPDGTCFEPAFLD